MADIFDDPEFRASLEKHGVRHAPGMAANMMEELTPLLAAEGIDLNDPNLSLEDLNEALARATEQRNLKNFTPVGDYRAWSLAALREFSIALAEGSDGAASVLDSIGPEETSERPAASHLIGASLGNLDSWFTDPALTRALTSVRIPQWHDKASMKAATDILALARKHRSFDSLDRLIIRHAGLAVTEGGALVVAGAMEALARAESSDVATVSARLLTSEGLPPLTSSVAARNTGAAGNRSGSAFGDLSGTSMPPLTAVDEALLDRFETWLQSEPDITAPSVELEISLFTDLVRFSRAESLDLGQAPELEQFIHWWFGEGTQDIPERALNAAGTIDDYIYFQIETSPRAEAWRTSHEMIGAVLDALFAEIDEPLDDQPGVLQEIIEETAAQDPAERIVAIRDLRPISATKDLLAWVGARRKVTQTGAVRRDEIGEVAALLGVDAVGVTQQPHVDFDAEPENATIYATSMWDVPALTSWWDALTHAQVIQTNTSSVRPGMHAAEWNVDSTPPLLTAERVAAEFAANLMTARLQSVRPSEFIASYELGVVAVTSARLTRALLGDIEEIPELPDDFHTQVTTARSLRLLSELENFGYLTLGDDQEVTIDPALRGVIAQSLAIALGLVRSLMGDE